MVSNSKHHLNISIGKRILSYILLNILKPYWRTDPPEIEIERSWIHTGVHQEAYLTCIVHAEPGATVWANRFSLLYFTLLFFMSQLKLCYRFCGIGKNASLFRRIRASSNHPTTNTLSSFVMSRKPISDFIRALPIIFLDDPLRILSFPVGIPSILIIIVSTNILECFSYVHRSP